MFGIGAGEFIVILIVGLIVFGPSKLPEVGRALGKGLREFRKAQAALSQTLNDVEVTEKKTPPPVEKPTPQAATTVDDVISLAKEKPIVKESSDEKIFNGTSNAVHAVDDASTSVACEGRNSNGTVKQSEPAANGTINPRG